MQKTLSWRQALAIGFLPFIALDLLKAGVAAWLAAVIQKRVPDRQQHRG